MSLSGCRKTRFVDTDILVIGGGFGGCGATYESRYWERDLKIVLVEKANIERSGAVAHGLSAINCYMGMRWNENRPEDHVRYARNDLMGLVREDLGFDIARHVDSTVYKFEEWGLPIMKDPKTGHCVRKGRWQIMIHGESYKARSTRPPASRNSRRWWASMPRSSRCRPACATTPCWRKSRQATVPSTCRPSRCSIPGRRRKSAGRISST